MNEPRECRCCRIPVPSGRLACGPHWKMLPEPIKSAVLQTYRDKLWRAYALNVRAADAFWQARGLWKPGVPHELVN